MSARRFDSVAFGLCVALGACGGSHGGSQSGGGGGSSGGTHTTEDAGASQAPASDAAAADAAGTTSAGQDFIAPTGSQAQQVAPLYAEATRAYRAGDFPTAARTFRQAYEIYPNPGTAYNAARAYERMGEVGDAIHFFDIVRASHPDPTLQADIERRVAALQAYEQRRRTGIAQTLPSQDALSAEGNDWFQRGVAFYRRHQYTQAEMAFEQAQNYLHTPELTYNLAVTFRALRNVDRALEFMREYLEDRRGTPEESFVQQQIHELESQR